MCRVRIAYRGGDSTKFVSDVISARVRALSATSRHPKSACYKRSMTNKFNFDAIPDDVLLQRLSQILKESRRVEVELVAHIGEV